LEPAVALPADAPPAVVARNEHGIYCVPLSAAHRPVAKAVLDGRVWESETLQLIAAADPALDVVHAGTFFGDFLVALAASRGPGAVVWAFEPSRENHRCAQITIALNQLENVVLARAGLGSEGRRALLAVSDRAGLALGGASRVIRDPARARWAESETVELLRIDDFIDAGRNVGVIHLDVEGHEQPALAGALDTITRCRPLLVVETLPDAEFIETALVPLGYRLDGSVNRNFLLRCR
jgi:FkbM family methyltransferase